MVQNNNQLIAAGEVDASSCCALLDRQEGVAVLEASLKRRSGFVQSKKYQWERKNGKSQREAIYSAQKECGKAILATSIILIGGFLVLIKSTTVTISILGIFTAMIVIFALAVDLILAPVLILICFKKYM